MNILQKLSTLARGTGTEAALAIIDRNGYGIMNQEIIDIEKSILIYKNTLAELMVSNKQLDREAAAIKTLIEKRETQAKRLIHNKEGRELVEDIAKDMAVHEVSLEGLGQVRTETEKRIVKIEGLLHKALLEVANYRRELRVLRAQRHHAHGKSSYLGLTQKLSELKETHKRLMEIQTHNEDYDVAWEEMGSKIDTGKIDCRLEALQGSDHQLRIQQILKRLQAD